MNAVIQQCIKVSTRIEIERFITDNQAQFEHVLDAEDVREYVDYDDEIESPFGSIVILLKNNKRVGWWNVYDGLLFVA